MQIVGLDIQPGDRIVLMLNQGGSVYGTYVRTIDHIVELGPGPDDNITRASVYEDQIVAVKVLPSWAV